MELFIKIDENVAFEYISENAEYMIREKVPYDDNTFVEHYFENGEDLLEFIDKEKILRDELPELTLVNMVLYTLANKFYRLGV